MRAAAGLRHDKPGETNMRAVAMTAMAAMIAVGCATAASAQDAKAKGEAVYTAQKCSLCHSVAGKGNPKGSLDGIGSKLSADEIRSWITDAKGMTAKTKATRKPE